MKKVIIISLLSIIWCSSFGQITIHKGDLDLKQTHKVIRIETSDKVKLLCSFDYSTDSYVSYEYERFIINNIKTTCKEYTFSEFINKPETIRNRLLTDLVTNSIKEFPEYKLLNIELRIK